MSHRAFAASMILFAAVLLIVLVTTPATAGRQQAEGSPPAGEPLPGPSRTLDCPPLPAGHALDGDLGEWVGVAGITLDRTTADYLSLSPGPAPADLSATVWCGWQGDALVLAADVADDLRVRDSAAIWHDDGVEFGFDAARDGWVWSSPDDHQFTVAVDAALTDLGVNPVPAATVLTRTQIGGWSLELRLPRGLLGTGELTAGQVLSFTVGLNDDDDGGNQDDQMIWAGRTTIGDSSGFGALHLIGVAATTTPTATSTPTGSPTVTLTPSPTPTSRPVRTFECPALGPAFVLDGDLAEWAVAPELLLNVAEADYIQPATPPAPADLSGVFYCGWRGDDLILAGRVLDDIILRDSAAIWQDDAVEFGIDGAHDQIPWGADDHQITLATDGTVADFGVSPVTGATHAIQPTVDGWQFELSLPPAVLHAEPFFDGKRIGFTVALTDDDDGGDRDTYMVWEGQTTYAAPQDYGTLILTGVPATATPTATSTPVWSLTPTPTQTPTSTPTSTPTVTPSLTPTTAYGSLSGVVWHDANGNAAREAGEELLKGVEISLLIGSTPIGSAITNWDGAYRFTMLLPGLYTVRETQPVGLRYSTTPDQVMVLVAGEQTVDFGDWNGLPVWLPLLVG